MLAESPSSASIMATLVQCVCVLGLLAMAQRNQAQWVRLDQSDWQDQSRECARLAAWSYVPVFVGNEPRFERMDLEAERPGRIPDELLPLAPRRRGTALRLADRRWLLAVNDEDGTRLLLVANGRVVSQRTDVAAWFFVPCHQYRDGCATEIMAIGARQWDSSWTATVLEVVGNEIVVGPQARGHGSVVAAVGDVTNNGVLLVADQALVSVDRKGNTKQAYRVRAPFEGRVTMAVSADGRKIAIGMAMAAIVLDRSGAVIAEAWLRESNCSQPVWERYACDCR
jgi:hypothetical protein